VIREWLLGRVVTRQPSEKTKEAWRKTYWRRPGEYVESPKLWPPGEEGTLMRSWFIFSIPPGIKLLINVHDSVDPLPHCHAHSGRFLSLVLKGGYIDERIDGTTGKQTFEWHKPWSFNWIPLHVYHRIHYMPKGKATTLCLIFPNVQEHGWWSQGKFTSMGRYFGEGRHLDAAAR
jgi:hypothetical protein